MRAHFPRSIGMLFLALAMISGCGPSTPLGKAGLTIHPGDAWKSIPPSQIVAPGDVIAAWSGPEKSSLVVFTSLPVPKPDPEAFAKEFATRLCNMPGITDATPAVVTLSGTKAARVNVLGMGDGSSFAPSGMGKLVNHDNSPAIPTHKVMFTFLRAADTLTVVWHFPESARATIEPLIDSTMTTLALSDSASAVSSY